MNAHAQFLSMPDNDFHGRLTDSVATKKVVELNNLQFSWPAEKRTVLDIKSLHIHQGERVFIEGSSGSGKSTLLNLIAGVVIPQNGSVSVLGSHLNKQSNGDRDLFRADHIGFIFQLFNLIPYLSIIENVTLPCHFSRLRREKAEKAVGSLEKEALRLLDHLGMADSNLLPRKVAELSVGQQQRVAAARALIGSPELLIADEPTSSLDTRLREDFIRLLFQECDRDTTTLVFVSHDPLLESFFDRTIRLSEINKAGQILLETVKEGM
jgi:putative ABC transport system ATP-binding protein